MINIPCPSTRRSHCVVVQIEESLSERQSMFVPPVVTVFSTSYCHIWCLISWYIRIYLGSSFWTSVSLVSVGSYTCSSKIQMSVYTGGPVGVRLVCSWQLDSQYISEGIDYSIVYSDRCYLPYMLIGWHLCMLLAWFKFSLQTSAD